MKPSLAALALLALAQAACGVETAEPAPYVGAGPNEPPSMDFPRDTVTAAPESVTDESFALEVEGAFDPARDETLVLLLTNLEGALEIAGGSELIVDRLENGTWWRVGAHPVPDAALGRHDAGSFSLEVGEWPADLSPGTHRLSLTAFRGSDTHARKVVATTRLDVAIAPPLAGLWHDRAEGAGGEVLDVWLMLVEDRRSVGGQLVWTQGTETSTTPVVGDYRHPDVEIVADGSPMELEAHGRMVEIDGARKLVLSGADFVLELDPIGAPPPRPY